MPLSQLQEAQSAYSPKDALRQEFGRRLQAELVRRGWNQSELARRASLHMPNKHMGRDLVSGYIRGRFSPTPVHLNALCLALGKKPEELFPDTGHANENAPVKTTQVEGNRVLLQINQVVDWPIALRILQILKGDDGGTN